VAGSITIGKHTINDDSHCYVIAEIGHNHQGSVQKARELFREAKLAGAHCVKLQKRNNRGLYTRAAYNKPYDNENSFGATYGEHREFLEFGLKEYKELQAYARELDIDFFATAFDIDSADFLASIDVPAYKIASGDLKSEPLLRHVAKFGKPIVISTGGAVIDDVRRAYDTIMPINPQLCMLQCSSTSSICGSSPSIASSSPRPWSASPVTTTALPWRLPRTSSARASLRSTSH
jgi:sialic acid synthase